jgi:nitrite reductase/ring-hydroxylating ferredoxin subunit
MKLSSIILALASSATLGQAFLLPSAPTPTKSSTRLAATVVVGPAAEIPNGERKIVDTDAGSIIVANVDGEFYAINSKCPHLGLPFKKGKISLEGGEPIITCSFHQSKFGLKDGVCKAWSESVFGIGGTEGIAKFVGGFGGAKGSPATVYPLEKSEDGVLSFTI